MNTNRDVEYEVGKDQYANVIVRINPNYFRPCEVELLLRNAMNVTNAREKLEWDIVYDSLEKLIEEMFS